MPMPLVLSNQYSSYGISESILCISASKLNAASIAADASAVSAFALMTSPVMPHSDFGFVQVPGISKIVEARMPSATCLTIGFTSLYTDESSPGSAGLGARNGEELSSYSPLTEKK